MHALRHALQRIALVVILLLGAAPAFAGDKVVYHFENAAEQGQKGLRNIRNHLDVAPDTKIVVVTHADGIDLLFEGARDPKGGVEYAPLISGLKAAGVTFEVCEITIKRRNIARDRFVMDADFTPSGVVRIAQLQAQQHFAYIKP